MTNKAKPILVPVDFSPHSEAAILFASDLAKQMKAPLVILHVVHDPGEAPGYYDKMRKKKIKQIKHIEDKAAEVMKSFLQRLVDEHSDLKANLKNAETKLVTGLPVTRILEVAKKLEPSMVVMGSQGRTGLAHLYLGSKAEQVVRLCPVPVTIVKASKS